MANSWDHVIGTDDYTTTLARARSIANENGWMLNPDTARMEKVLGLMTMNFTETGEFFCPCKQSHPWTPGPIPSAPVRSWTARWRRMDTVPAGCST